MSTTIAIHELEAAVKKAIGGIKIGPGPILIGFVAPDTLKAADAQHIAEKVSANLGLDHKTAELGFKPAYVSHGGHITIGIIATNPEE